MTPSERMASCEAITGDVDPWHFSKAIGKSHEIEDYLRAFGGYLKACGVRNFTALEVSTPSKSSQKIAARTGATKSMHRGQFVLVAPVWLWAPMAAVVLLSDEIRDELGAPITLRNGIRPWWLNQSMSTSGIASDHPQTAAVDLDLSRSGDLKAAHRMAECLYMEHEHTLKPSLGQGSTVIHFSIHSPHGHRQWRY